MDQEVAVRSISGIALGYLSLALALPDPRRGRGNYDQHPDRRESEVGDPQRRQKERRPSRGDLQARREFRNDYSKRLVDCANSQFMYLGSGDTLEKMNGGGQADSKMASLTEGSVSTYVSAYACQNAR
jgi:hypothetical protein